MEKIMLGDKFKIREFDDVYMLVRLGDNVGVVDIETGKSLGDDYIWLPDDKDITIVVINKLFGYWSWEKLI